MDWDTDALQVIREGIWEGLRSAVGEVGHGWRTPVMVTGGGNPQGRVVVLRRVEVEGGELVLEVHTDGRSAKMGQIWDGDGQVCFVFYDAGGGVQVRASGGCLVHREDAVAEERWREVPEASRLSYLTEEVPGTRLRGMKPKMPFLLRPYEGLKHFAVLRCRVGLVDWLWLREGGHRRAVFEEVDGYSGSWVVP